MADKRTLTRKHAEQAEQVALRLFGLPMGADPESVDVLRYFFAHELKWENGVIPEDVESLELPSVPELFRMYRDKVLGDRPTGMWTVRRRAHKAQTKTPRRL